MKLPLASRFVSSLALAAICSLLCQLPLAQAQPPNAWQITDSSTGTGSTLIYTSTLTAGQRIAATNVMGGFRWTVVARMVDRRGNDRSTMLMAYGLGNQRFLIWFDLDGSGDLTASFDDVNTITLTTGGLGATLYHTHEIIYNPTNGTASYLFDGQVKTNNWPAVSHNLPAGQLQYGAGAQTGTGRMNFHSVNFDITGLGSVANYDAGTSNNPALAPDPTDSVPAWTLVQGTGTATIDISPDVVSLPTTPEATTLDAYDVGSYQATLAGVINQGNQPTTAWFEWGADTNYGNATPPQALLSGTNDFNVSRTIIGLAAGGTYHFRCVASNVLGVAYGQDAVFTTPLPTTPEATTLDAYDVGPYQATLAGVIIGGNLPTTAWFEWGADTNYGNATPPQALLSGTNDFNLSRTIIGLAAAGTYHFRCVATNALGVAYGQDAVFTTTNFNQQAYLKASNTDARDGFGFSVAMWLDSVIVGAPEEDSNADGVDGDQADNSAPGSGAAYLFVRDGSAWTQQAYLKKDGSTQGENFGASVAMRGELPGLWCLVGAPRASASGMGGAGEVTVFYYGGRWLHAQTLRSFAPQISAQFGHSVAIGYSDALPGSYGLVGEPYRDTPGGGSDAGAVDTFNYNSGREFWEFDEVLFASSQTSGARFGWSIAASGDTIVVGAPGHTSSQGRAFVYKRDGFPCVNCWVPQGSPLALSAPSSVDKFGESVAISGDTIVVGAPGRNNNGRAYVFTRTGTTWSQQAELTSSHPVLGGEFSASVAVEGNTVVIGERNPSGRPDRAYVFLRSGTNWSQQTELTPNRPDVGDNFGASVAIHFDTVVVGADLEDGSATGVDGNQADNSAFNSGAAYVFEPGAFVPTEFRITSIVRTNDNDLLITWITRGTTNIVQVAAGAGVNGGFTANDFADITNIVVTTATTNFWDVGATTNNAARFYRIRLP